MRLEWWVKEGYERFHNLLHLRESLVREINRSPSHLRLLADLPFVPLASSRDYSPGPVIAPARASWEGAYVGEMSRRGNGKLLGGTPTGVSAGTAVQREVKETVDIFCLLSSEKRFPS